ncbi:MAG TPA: discoidin domain-containing protein [Acidobacteriota bacterium]|nr:discoidin domain-containing protein [Acidobacteriota bacterium]
MNISSGKGPEKTMRFRYLLNQAWTIAKIEMKRSFFSRRAFWIYALALFPSVIFIGQIIQVKIRGASLSSGGLTPPALIDGIRTGESPEAVIDRLGEPPLDRQWTRTRRMLEEEELSGITTHIIDPVYEARFVRLAIIRPTYINDRTARIYGFEVYGDGGGDLALGRPATGSSPCSADQGPEKAFDGSVSGGITDRWCSQERNLFLQVDLGAAVPIHRIVIKHASAGGESRDLNTSLFTVQASDDDIRFTTIVNPTGARLVDEISRHRRLVYFDGRREARLDFDDGKLISADVRPLKSFEEDRRIFAGVFHHFYLRLAIFFGCLGIFMNLFRGETLDKTLHFWFLSPVRRDVLMVGKYGAGLIASTVVFAGGVLLCYAIILWSGNPAEVRAFTNSGGVNHVFRYAAVSMLACAAYGSIYLAAGLLIRNPIIPAAVLLGWESINGFLPAFLQKISVLYYLQSLSPVAAPLDQDMPALLKLLLAPAVPASSVEAVTALLAITLIFLWIASRAIRRMQISYG